MKSNLLLIGLCYMTNSNAINFDQRRDTGPMAIGLHGRAECAYGFNPKNMADSIPAVSDRLANVTGGWMLSVASDPSQPGSLGTMINRGKMVGFASDGTTYTPGVENDTEAGKVIKELIGLPAGSKPNVIMPPIMEMTFNNEAKPVLTRVDGKDIIFDKSNLAAYYNKDDSHGANLEFVYGSFVERNANALSTKFTNAFEPAASQIESNGNITLNPHDLLFTDLLAYQAYANRDNDIAVSFDTGPDVKRSSYQDDKPYKCLYPITIDPTHPIFKHSTEMSANMRSTKAASTLFGRIASILSVASSSSVSPLETIYSQGESPSNVIGQTSPDLTIEESNLSNFELYKILSKMFDTNNTNLPFVPRYDTETTIAETLQDYYTWFEGVKKNSGTPDGINLVDDKEVAIMRGILPYIEQDAGITSAEEAKTFVLNKMMDRLDYHHMLGYYDDDKCAQVFEKYGKNNITKKDLEAIGITDKTAQDQWLNSPYSDVEVGLFMQVVGTAKSQISSYDDLLGGIRNHGFKLSSNLLNSTFGVMLQFLYEATLSAKSSEEALNDFLDKLHSNDIPGSAEAGLLFKAKQVAAIFLNSNGGLTMIDPTSTVNTEVYKAAKKKMDETDLMLYLPGKPMRLHGADTQTISATANGHQIYLPDLEKIHKGSVFSVFDNSNGVDVEKFKACMAIIDTLQLFGDQLYDKLDQKYIGTKEDGTRFINTSSINYEQANPTQTTQSLSDLIKAIMNLELDCKSSYSNVDATTTKKTVKDILKNLYKTDSDAIYIQDAPYVKNALEYAINHIRYAYPATQARYHYIFTNLTTNIPHFFAELFTWNMDPTQAKPWVIAHKEKDLTKGELKDYMPFALMPTIWRSTATDDDMDKSTQYRSVFGNNNKKDSLYLGRLGSSAQQTKMTYTHRQMKNMKDEGQQNLDSAATSTAPKHELSFIDPMAVWLAESMQSYVARQVIKNFAIAAI